MLLPHQLNVLFEKQLKEQQIGNYFGTGISLCKDGNKMFLVQQAVDEQPAKCFLYRHDNGIWILEYLVTMSELLLDATIDDYVVDGWLDADGLSFSVKVCNKEDSGTGITVHYQLVDENGVSVYKEIERKKNGRISLDGVDFHLDGMF